MKFEVYCDESNPEFFKSRREGRCYVLIGGVWVRAEDRAAHKAAIKEIRQRHNVHGEFKWNRVSPSRLEFYTDIVKWFFATREARFRTIVLKVDELNDKLHQCDNELAFYKFYYQVLHHWILDQNSYRVFVDTRTNRLPSRLGTLQRCLECANLTSQVTVQALPSHELDLMQVADVLIGAVGYSFHDRRGSTAKEAVVRTIQEATGRAIGSTPKSEEKFNVFRFRAGGGW
jgi:hypothetical protein